LNIVLEWNLEICSRLCKLKTTDNTSSC